MVLRPSVWYRTEDQILEDADQKLGALLEALEHLA